MLLAGLQTEHVAGKVEGADLPAPVVQDPVGANGAGENLVDVVRRLAFAENLRVAIERHRHARELDRIEQRIDRRNGTGGGSRRVAGGDLGSCLSEHGVSPPNQCRLEDRRSVTVRKFR